MVRVLTASSGDSGGDTLFLPAGSRRDRPRDSAFGLSLPPDLQAQVVRRLSLAALMYAAAFFLADFLPSMFFVSFRDRFQHLSGWIYGLASIAFALGVFGAVASGRLSWRATVILGLVFQVVGSYGIALAQYAGLAHIELTDHLVNLLSPSWVGVWMVVYAVIVPAPPRLAIPAALVSATAAPVVVWATLGASGQTPLLLPPVDFFFRHVFPYLICALLALGGGRVVFRLGVAVKHARELGSYRLIEQLGRGGMGEVWRASHHMLARPAAIKFIRTDVIASANPGDMRLALKRFEMEAQATASLTSPHTVALYDYGATDDGRFYYVMELLDGLDLDALVRRFGPLPLERVVHFVTQVCDSLEEAHAKGLVHRDIKPANIYACRSGNHYDFAKVLDFGLVTRDRALSPDQTSLTQAEHATGTPAYMAPEVAAGKPADSRADLYALGCVAYWLVAGRQVFEGATIYELVHQHMSVAPEPPSRFAAGLPSALDAVILRCLEKDPARRPADARELARLMRAVPAATTWDDDRARDWWLAHRPAAETQVASATHGDLT